MTQLPVLADLGLEIDPQLWALAFVHRSWSYENGQVPTNERLEFLGDAVLQIIVTEHLYHSFPDEPEGQLARMRAAVVNTRALAGVARGLHLGQRLQLGRGETTTGGDDKDSILADTMEAVIGAVFLSAGRDGAWTFVRHLFLPLVDRASRAGAGLDWKSSLQEVAAERGWDMPTYTFEQSGPDHQTVFSAWCHVAGQQFGPGEGRAKKVAEQAAASIAWRHFNEG